MRHPAVRWSVLAIAVVAAAGCCYWAATLERRALDQRRTLSAATNDARSLQKALADTRRALSAMASPGQAAVSWSRQATASIDMARAKLAALMTTEGGAGLRPHAERLDKLADAEARLHDNAVSGRALMASDVAFGEALPHVDALDHQVAETIGAMIETADRDLASARDQQILALAGALGVLGVAAVLLTPTPRRRDDDTPAATTEGTEPVADGLALAATPAPVAPPAAAAHAPSMATPAALPTPRVELTPLAAACDALARLADGDTLPAVLDTVRPALGARGIAVWLAGADQKTLQVVASSGYDRRIVERFPVIGVSDDNPTAKAFARVRPMTLAADAGQPAAVAVPIAGARGTTGVLSLEMLGAREASADVLAAAGIVASQLATLLEPLPKPDAEPADVPPVRAELG
ncbi:MAG: GAF domain-containing protein [Acidobacteria bacterium]|nr:GAF domain-containing protein [Acidobacteriota bacterium]